MARKDRMSGNEAVSFAIRQINPDVMPAFPITPSTEIPQMVSTYIANGEIDTEFVPVESEHSAMSAAIGSEAAGARTLTATSSAGLALMWEELLLAASNRMPIALALVNRTLSGPININCDHSEILDGFRFMRKTIRKPMITLFRHIQSPKVLESIYRS
jgi:pyruvate ferredoxin oxidoreductase alpha subunit